jgi:hypothetical protein
MALTFKLNKTNKMEIKQTFTIDCNTWRCGDDGKYKLGEGNTALLNDKGFMCCLGQVALQLDVHEADLLGVGEPEGVESDTILGLLVTNEWDEDSENDIKHNTVLSSEAMGINDNGNTTIETKINDLKELFKADGYGLEFINIPADVKQQQ